MIELPHALLPWKEELAIFPRDMAVTLGPWLPRLSLAFGPLSSNQHVSSGEVDGFRGLTRRGPYERLLISEWLLAGEMPEEFARRAAMGEHAFLELARREPHGSRRSIALFDAGPNQLGTPRLAHLAALIVLSRRAREHGAELGWGILQKPEGWCWGEVNPTSVLGLLEARTLHETSAVDLEDWLERLSETRAPDDLWIIGGRRLSALARALSAQRVREVARATRVEIEDVCEPGARSILLRIFRGARTGAGVAGVAGVTGTPAELALQLPDEPSCVRLLRDPFEVRAPAPVRLPHPVRPAGNLLFSSDSRKVLVRLGGDSVMALHPPAAPRAQAGSTRFLSSYGEHVAAVGVSGPTFYMVSSDTQRIAVREYSRRGKFRDLWNLPPLEETFPFWHPGAHTPLQPCLLAPRAAQAPPAVMFTDAIGRLLMASAAPNGHPRQVELVLTGVTAAARVAGTVVAVRESMDDEYGDRGVYAISRAPTGSTLLHRLPVHVAGDGDLNAYFGYGASLSHPHYGLLAVRARAEGWMVFSRERAFLFTPPPDLAVFGVGTSRKLNWRPVLLAIESDLRSVCAYGEDSTKRLFSTEEKIVFACAATGAPNIAWISASGAVSVFSIEHERQLFRVAPGESP